jgi:hydrogenase maturation protein HypF
MGRLFDAVASLAGIRQVSRFEGQAAMELEFALRSDDTTGAYSLPIVSQPDRPLELDWEPMLRELLDDVSAETPAGLISRKFHHGLVQAIVTTAIRVGMESVVLTGGCFQNRYLCEQSVPALRHSGLRPYWHQRIPPNDGGIALGQAIAAGSLP